MFDGLPKTVVPAWRADHESSNGCGGGLDGFVVRHGGRMVTAAGQGACGVGEGTE